MREKGSRLENFVKAGAVFLGVLLLILSVASFNAISTVRGYLENENARRLAAIAVASAVMAGIFIAVTAFFAIRPYISRRKKSQSEEPSGRNDVSFVVDTFHSLVSQLKEKEKELQELKERAEERARTVESYNESVLRNIQSGVMTFDKDGAVITENLAADKILELEPGASAGKNIEDVFNPECWISSLIKRTIAGGKPERRGEGEVRLKGGGVKWLGAGASPLYRGGSLEGAILVFTDITEIKELRERMEMKERIAVLGEMSAGIAHEMRNPMGVISGYTEYLARKLKDDVELNQAAESIRAEIRTMDEIIREFMNFSQPTELNITEVDLNAAIEEALRAAAPAGGDVQVSFRKDEGLPVIEGDSVLLRQAFLNIIKNAFEAMPGGGDLEINTDMAEAGVRGDDLNLPPGKYIRARISDNGEGIDDETMKKIFMPFFTTKAKGTGLGLALVQKILVYHGGRVSVKSVKGKGTVFTVSMPVKRERLANV